MITTKILNSLITVRPEHCEGKELQMASLCKNESFSFQLAYKITDGSQQSIPFFIKVISDLPINSYYVGCVPILHADYSVIEPKQSIGMYPDILVPKKINPDIVKTWHKQNRYYEAGEKVMLCAYNDSWQAVWFAVNEDCVELPAGRHHIMFEVYSRTLELVGQNELYLDIIDEALPEQSFIYTNWFHYDCLSDYYGEELFSERYFVIMRDFVRKAVKNGMNMLLMPVFTPPLDTPVGAERKTAQLVKIKVVGGKYIFDFSLLKHFVNICKQEGIRYFEHSHLFTQWGAEHAPKIVADIDGKEVRIFGWDTDAAGDEYIGFLRAYLTELKKFLKDENLEKNILFHISDEPKEINYHNYERVYGKIKDLLEEYMVGDALSDPKFYESGLVKIPIAMTKEASRFLGKGENIWCYYYGEHIDKGMSNRLIQLPRERNRMLGIQMYYNKIKGFLHWAYNFYYGELCNGAINPYMDPCGGYPNAGTSYFAYPSNDGTAHQSVRQKIFYEGLIDMRALQLLEKLSDRSTCEALIEKYFGIVDFYTSPDCPEVLIEFREALNDKIRYYGEKNARYILGVTP